MRQEVCHMSEGSVKTAIRTGKVSKTAEKLFYFSIVAALIISAIIMGIARYDTDITGEADMGSFSTRSFNEGWRMDNDSITLPATVDSHVYDEVTIINTLPDDISDGSTLMIRSSMEDVYIYVDGDIRTFYSTDSIRGMPYYIPSAYVVADLDSADSGKTVRITFKFKSAGELNEVVISNGNNAWFKVISDSLPVNLIALFVLAVGVIIVIVTLLLNGSYHVTAPRSLGLLMVNVALWVFGESTLRQIIFRRATLSQYFSYINVELIGIFVCMFHDEVQRRRYHKRYLAAEIILFVQLMLNILLDVIGICELYRTLLISHLWAGAGFIMIIVTLITDGRKHQIRGYRITAIGMICFVAMALVELLGFYINRFHLFGSSICIGLLLLMTATILQTVSDEVRVFHEREEEQLKTTITTIETIASAIDARDEYTGGHSERVGLYAVRLAREMAPEYGLSEEQILRIHYIGLMHDIGKIGVADSVLNKSGRLTNEEFSLMKKHPEIGYEIMQSLGGSIDSLLDGIRYHHERYDGHGYPDGLAGTGIPLIARILALADSFDAMTSNRVYRKRLTDEEVRSELLRCSGTQFDPELTTIFVRLLDRGELKLNTVDGVAADESGRVMKSALLESRLQHDLLADTDISNPSHVRMLCYVMKLMEKKGNEYTVLFTGLTPDEKDGSGETWASAKKTISEHIGSYDVNIEYTGETNIIALYDRNDSQVNDFIAGLKGISGRITIDKL